MIAEHKTLNATLKTYFGYDQFRPQQKEIVETVLQKKDCLVIMPTGGGKSICFQLPALLMDGVTLVISPLIALMKDQVDGLKANGVEAEFFNSSQSERERDSIIDKVIHQQLRLLYVAPESLAALENVLETKYISCIAIDEAHCISAWGHDFRSSYQRLGFLKRKMPTVPVIALTATADKATRQDILTQLEIPRARCFITSFDRKNIQLEVRPANERLRQIRSFISRQNGAAGIVYCLSRKSTEKLAEKLSADGISAAAYHAGLSFAERSRIQEAFIFDKIQVVCATIAFGMGIDKSNVRWVIHYNMPKNIEGYYQEIGRAGRDGLPAKALLFHSFADVIQLRNFMEGASNEEFQRAKLDRMMQFSEATSCRRKILLSYFGELLHENCGNCDVCKNPPTFFDGTIYAQKILSVITRVKQQEPAGVIIDVLRGAFNARIREKQYQTLKSYGVGRDITWKDWQHYIVQLINQGYCEIAFHQNNVLLLTEFSGKVLFEGQKVFLTRPLTVQEKAVKLKKTIAERPIQNTLFERLRKLRYAIAQEENIPAYLVFNDATLTEIEQVRPICEADFMEISGVGRRKLEVYGDRFMNEIIAFLEEKRGKARKQDTHMKTYELYQQGLSVEQISANRALKPLTVFSHLARLYAEGKSVDLYRFVSREEVSRVREARLMLQNKVELKPYFEYLNEEIEYPKIRLALTILEKEG